MRRASRAQKGLSKTIRAFPCALLAKWVSSIPFFRQLSVWSAQSASMHPPLGAALVALASVGSIAIMNPKARPHARRVMRGLSRRIQIARAARAAKRASSLNSQINRAFSASRGLSGIQQCLELNVRCVQMAASLAHLASRRAHGVEWESTPRIDWNASSANLGHTVMPPCRF